MCVCLCACTFDHECVCFRVCVCVFLLLRVCKVKIVQIVKTTIQGRIVLTPASCPIRIQIYMNIPKSSFLSPFQTLNVDAETVSDFNTIGALKLQKTGPTCCNLIFEIYFTELHLQIFPYLQSTWHFTITILVSRKFKC